MLRLHRLSSEPECFDPIHFTSGVNLILGERSEGTDNQGRKVNGVGKSICVEFLHFALCRKHSETRISKIPEDVLPRDLVVALDVTIGTERMQIRRSLANPNQPAIVLADGREVVFQSLDDVTHYLGELLFAGDQHAGQVSFRQVVSVLMRDEASSFASPINPHDAALRVPDDITPHLYLMGIDGTTYCRLLDTIKKLETQQRALKELKAVVTNQNERKISDVPTILNEERQATRQIEEALETLRADPAFEQVEGDLNSLEAELQILRSERKKLSFQIDQIRSIPLPERIDAYDLKIVYDRIKSGLGELVEKSLEQAREFKAEIEKFQQTLRQQELAELEARRRELSTKIRAHSDKHAEFTRQVDRRGVLKELKTGLEVATRRTDEYHRLESEYKRYNDKLQEVEDTKTDRSNDLHSLVRAVAEYRETEDSLNDTIVAFHNQIQKSSRASFRFDVNTKPTAKRPLTFHIRVQDDGSRSINEVRVFIYDFALMFDSHCRKHHPGFLLHDNILEVDQDTLTQCLNFLHEKAETEDQFQYILTLNRDKIEAEELRHDIKLNINDARRATFTKSKQFLRVRYQESS
jgi:uncharacterized protein YydD (DUF2326 family)